MTNYKISTKRANKAKKELKAIKRAPKDTPNPPKDTKMQNPWRKLKFDNWLVTTCKKIGYKTPTKIQAEAIPKISNPAHKSILIHSETGSGKTAAFAFPILNSLFRDPRGIYSIIVAPSREVAIQIKEQIKFFGSSNNIRCVCVIGGTDYTKQKKQLEEIPHIVVGTPGRLAEQISRSKTVQKYLTNMEFLVLDEVDKLFNETLGHFIRLILDYVPPKVRCVFSSATIETGDLEKISGIKLGGKVKGGDGKGLEIVLKDVEMVSCHRAVEKAKSVTLRYCLMPKMIKDCYLVELLNKYDGNDIIVFFNSCE